MRENILFVVDDENILRSLETLFAGDDVTIILADNAKEALRLMGTREIALLVTDKRMPEMSGIELLTVIKGSFPDNFDALTSKRPYREPAPWDQAINLMDALGGIDLDPELMNIFHSAIVKGLDTNANVTRTSGNDYGQLQI